jgi:hypothetical protein
MTAVTEPAHPVGVAATCDVAWGRAVPAVQLDTLAPRAISDVRTRGVDTKRIAVVLQDVDA